MSESATPDSSGLLSVPSPPKRAASSDLKFLGGCLKIAFEILLIIIAITFGPPIVLALIAHFAWPWYSSGAGNTDLNDALIALASVGGVLWSGAIVAYSIHKKYTPPLRTGVQLLHFAILSPLVALIGHGASLRTAIYFVGHYYALSTLFSISNIEMLKPGKFSLKVPDPSPDESAAVTKVRKSLAEIRAKDIKLFKRFAHGTWYFAFVTLLCAAIFITANVTLIAWACFVVLIISLFLMLPEVFSLEEQPPEEETA